MNDMMNIDLKKWEKGIDDDENDEVDIALSWVRFNRE